jgi:aminoglycoside phosphotransferase family enzyme
VYLGTVALRSGPGGRLTLRAEGVVVDWLVQMRRLPADRMLDQRIRNRSISRADVDAVIRRLCDYYRRCPPLGVLAAEYRRQLLEDIVANRVALSVPDRSMPRRLVEDTCAGQLAFLARSSASLDARVHAGRIVEGHGDLRPEHICLESPPQIIDCLEFSRVLRTLDVVDELGFLALECERLRAPALRRQILDSYGEQSGDAPPDALVHFYQSHRACVRANLAIRHLDEPVLTNPAAWRARAGQYLELAHEHARHCNESATALH